MTKQSDTLANLVAKSVPHFQSVGSFLYRSNPVLMLRGFAFDMPPGGCYIWKYYLPLFGSVDFLNMSLGYRLENGYLETSGRSKEDISRDAINIISKYDDLLEEESMEELVSFARTRLVSPVERAKLFQDIECFKCEEIHSILERVDGNKKRIGVEK